MQSPIIRIVIPIVRIASARSSITVVLQEFVAMVVVVVVMVLVVASVKQEQQLLEQLHWQRKGFL